MDLDFIESIRPPAELIAFLLGYDDAGVWSRPRALQVRAAAAARALTLAARHVVRFQRVRVCSLRLRLQATGQSHLRTTHDGGLPLGGAGAFAGAARMAQQWYARAVGPCMFAIEWCFS